MPATRPGYRPYTCCLCGHAGGEPTPLPYLFVCAFIANAASFVLPISNPANLVIFGAQMPDLAAWLAQFGPPSIISIGVTYLALRMT